jgi:hypothetical protein
MSEYIELNSYNDLFNFLYNLDCFDTEIFMINNFKNEIMSLMKNWLYQKEHKETIKPIRTADIENILNIDLKSQVDETIHILDNIKNEIKKIGVVSQELKNEGFNMNMFNTILNKLKMNDMEYRKYIVFTSKDDIKEYFINNSDNN